MEYFHVTNTNNRLTLNKLYVSLSSLSAIFMISSMDSQSGVLT